MDTPAAQSGVEGLETPSTAIDADPATHTPEQMATIQEYQGAVDKGILSFVDRWRGLKDPNYRKKVRMDIAQVDQRTVQDVRAAVGVDISDFTGHSLSGNALEHIDLRHGAKGEADHSMADPNDIARMGYVLEHYDSVEPLIDRYGKPVLSGEYYNADGSHAPQVRFQKRVDGTYYVVEAVPDAATREFRVVSAYMQKGSDSTGQELTYHKSDPQLTSETHLNAHTIASENSIPQTAQDVKPVLADYPLAQRMGKNGQKGISQVITEARQAEGVQDGVAEARLVEGYIDLYMAGLNGTKLESGAMPLMAGENAQKLTVSQRMQAYYNGVNDAAARVEANKRTANFAKVAGTEKGLVYDSYVENELTAETADRINDLAKRLNLRVSFVDNLAGGVANGQIVDADIYISTDAQSPEMMVLGHEVGHWLEKTAPKEYQALRRFVSQKSQAEINYRMAVYETMGKELDYDAAVREFVNDDIGQMIADPETLNKFIAENRENRTLLQRVADALRALWQKLTGKERQQVKTAEDALLAALRASERQAAALEKAGQTMDFATETAETGAEYQIKTLPDGKKYVQADRQVIFGNDPEGWSRQLEDYINGKIRKGENVQLVAADGDVLTLTADTAGKVSSPFRGDGTKLSATEFERKVDAGAHIDELAEVSRSQGKKKKDAEARHGDFASQGWDYRDAYFQDFDGKYYQVNLSVAIGEDGKVIYNIGAMQERSLPTVTGSSAKGGAQSGEKASLEGSVSQSGGEVNGEFSLKDQSRVMELERENAALQAKYEQARKQTRRSDAGKRKKSVGAKRMIGKRATEAEPA